MKRAAAILLVAGIVLPVLAVAVTFAQQANAYWIISMMSLAVACEIGGLLLFFKPTMEMRSAGGNVFYHDPLVSISDREIRLHRYYLAGGDKRIAWNDVAFVAAEAPSIWSGKWRLWGTGTFFNWFACDFDRPARQTIFNMSLRSQRINPVFTAQNAASVKRIFAEHGVLDDREGETSSSAPAEIENAAPRPVVRPIALYVVTMLFLASILQAVYFHRLMPPHVATHFSVSGAVVRWGTPAELAGITIISAGIIAASAVGLSSVLRRTMAASISALALWLGVAALGLVFLIMQVVYQANLTPSPRLGLVTIYPLMGYVVFYVLWLIFLVRRLAR